MGARQRRPGSRGRRNRHREARGIGCFHIDHRRRTPAPGAPHPLKDHSGYRWACQLWRALERSQTPRQEHTKPTNCFADSAFPWAGQSITASITTVIVLAVAKDVPNAQTARKAVRYKTSIATIAAAITHVGHAKAGFQL